MNETTTTRRVTCACYVRAARGSGADMELCGARATVEARIVRDGRKSWHPVCDKCARLRVETRPLHPSRLV